MAVRYRFEYSPLRGHNAGQWFSGSGTWKTRIGAERAADRWADGMGDEDCPVQTRIREVNCGQ